MKITALLLGLLLALGLGLGGRLTFAGALGSDAVAAEYALADLLVVASRRETYGMVVTEALARAVDSDPENYDALFNLAVVAREAGVVEQARGALEQFIATAPPDRYGGDIERARGWLDQLRR